MIKFKDDNLKRAIMRELNLTNDDIEKLNSLDTSCANISDLSGFVKLLEKIRLEVGKPIITKSGGGKMNDLIITCTIKECAFYNMKGQCIHAERREALEDLGYVGVFVNTVACDSYWEDIEL